MKNILADIKNQEFIAQELKRCADEIATTDINMQTIRDMINSEGEIKTDEK